RVWTTVATKHLHGPEKWFEISQAASAGQPEVRYKSIAESCSWWLRRSVPFNQITMIKRKAPLGDRMWFSRKSQLLTELALLAVSDRQRPEHVAWPPAVD